MRRPVAVIGMKVPVNKVFIEQNTPEPKVKAMIPM